MENNERYSAEYYKNGLLSNDVKERKDALLEITEKLQTSKAETFAKVLLDLDIPAILLHVLINSGFSDNLDVLKCISLLCDYTIYYTLGHAVNTANTVLKNIMCLGKADENDHILVESLKIITTIIKNLDKHTASDLNFAQYLTAVRKFLTLKNDPLLICTIIKMYGALLLCKKFQLKLDNNLFDQLEGLCDLSLQKLSKIPHDGGSELIGASVLLDSILQCLIKIKMYKPEKIDNLLNKMQDISFKCLKNVCIPYVAEFGANFDICLEYLCFLRTFFKSNLNKNIINSISMQIVKENNFVIITQYLEKTADILDDEQTQIRSLCLMILCEVIVNISDIDCPLYNAEKCKKNLFKSLEKILGIYVQHWLSCLNDSKIHVDTKYAVIRFCTVYYVHSNNFRELKFEHLKSMIHFLGHFPVSISINNNFVKDLWLLFAVAFNNCFREISNESALFKATKTLGTLILSQEKSFDEIVSYHPSIIYEIFINPFVKKDVTSIVVNAWLAHSLKHPPTHNHLVQIVSQFPAAATRMLATLHSGPLPHATAAASVLRVSLQNGPLAGNEDFTRQVFAAVPASINKLSQGRIIDDKVKMCIYLMHLSSFTATPPDRCILSCHVNFVANTVGTFGLNKLPTLFYTGVFGYINKILTVARSNQFREVFSIFMNSKAMLSTMQGALVSDDRDMAIQASHLFNELLRFQTHHRYYSRNTIVLKKDFLIKIMCVKESAHLELNLQILEMVLCRTTRTVLDFEIDEEFVKGLYFRCLDLVVKPGNHNLRKFSLKCLEGILRFAQTRNYNSLDYLLEQSGNHSMIMVYLDPRFRRPVDRTFLSFIQCWLQFSIKKKENILNQWSIVRSFWKITLHKIMNVIIGIKTDRDNKDLINNILIQMFSVIELLPSREANYLRGIQEYMN